MRVAVDATSLLDVRTGVGRFTAAVVSGLAGRPDVELTLFPVSLRGRRRLRNEAPPGVRTVAPPLPARLLRSVWRHGDRPRIDRAIGTHDVVYGPNFVVPPTRAARVVTVHDLTAVRFPELCDAVTRDYPDQIRRAADAGAWIHTVSEAVRAEVIELLEVPPDRVVAIHSGPTGPVGGGADRGRRLAGREAYALAVGTVEPRKDLPTLLRAIDALAARGVEVPLVHVGPDGWGAETFETTLAAMERPDLVSRLGRRSDAQLADLYAGARLVAYPSRYEGFGFPLLEAMSAGVPVVTTRVPAMVEVGGDAVELAAVGDASDLGGALARVWTDEARRRVLVAAGARRVADFSWTRTVDGLVGLFERAADGRPGSGDR